MKNLFKKSLLKTSNIFSILFIALFFFVFVLPTKQNVIIKNKSLIDIHTNQISIQKVEKFAYTDYFCHKTRICIAENFSPETSIYSFAKCKNNCLLFKTSNINNTNYDNVLFELPNSYFVSIISSTSDAFYKVRYKNFIGFVDTQDIEVMNIYPNEPYLENITFGISANSATQLRSAPDSNNQSNILTIIPTNTQNIKYIAKTSGTIPTGGSSDIWYYAEYTPISDPTSVYQGYVYSEKTTNLTPILLNLETSNFTTKQQDVSESLNDDSIAISPNFKTILIVLICLPIVIVFLVSILKTRASKHSNNEQQTNKTINENFKNEAKNNLQTENSVTSSQTKNPQLGYSTNLNKNNLSSANNNPNYNCNFLGTSGSQNQNYNDSFFTNNDALFTTQSNTNYPQQKENFAQNVNASASQQHTHHHKQSIASLKNKKFRRAPTVFETFATSSTYPNHRINFEILDEDDDLL